jgi:hypothetical protein
MGVRVLVYTTPSHTNVAPRWRILLPISRGDYEVRMRAEFCARVNGRFGKIFANESFTLSQSYYFGLAMDNTAPDHRCEVIDGRFIDLCDEFLKYQKDGGPEGQQNSEPSKTGDEGDAGDSRIYEEDFNYVGHLKSMGDGPGLQGFNSPLTRAASSYAYHHGSDFDREALKGKLREAIRAAPKKPSRKVGDIERYLSDDYLDDVIASAIKKFGTEKHKANEDVERLNRMHAVLPIGGKTRVVTFGELPDFPGLKTIVMTQTLPDFAALNNKYRHSYHDKKGELQSQPMGTHWINSPKRRQYDGGMAFMPQPDSGVGNKLNLWNDFGVKPIKPDGTSGEAGCKKFLDFMFKIICDGNETHFDYLLKREATILQRRVRSEIALGLRTKEEGCGKGFYEATMGRLLGNHAMQITNPKHIIGAFNPHLETLLRLTADEALFVGSHEHRNALFGLITEAKLTIEPKGCGVYTADSFLNISITSNADHFLPISGTARRFFVPTVSTARMQDFVYFNNLKTGLEDGGYEALLYHMLHEVDLKDFNVRDVPKTAGLMEQRNHSLTPLEAWWCELLETGTLMGADPDNPNCAVSNSYARQIEIKTDTNTQIRHVTQLGIYDQAKLIEPRLKSHTSDHRLGAHLSLMGCDNRKKVLRRRGWTFPSLSDCRAEWEKRYPGWKWRDAEITKWRPEDADDVGSEGDRSSMPDNDDAEPKGDQWSRREPLF